MKLEKLVFSQKEFIEAASKKFVLLEIDAPKKKKLPKEVKKQNEALEKRFAIEGHPTLMLCDSQGRPYADLDIPKTMTPKAMGEILTKGTEIKVKRDASFALAEKAEGMKKIELIAKAFEVLPDYTVFGGYPETLKEVAKLDPKDKSGLIAKVKNTSALARFETELFEADNLSQLAIDVDKYIKDNKLEGEQRQEIQLYKFYAFEELSYKDESYIDRALDEADEIIKIDPNTEAAKEAQDMKDSILQEEREKNGHKPT